MAQNILFHVVAPTSQDYKHKVKRDSVANQATSTVPSTMGTREMSLFACSYYNSGRVKLLIIVHNKIILKFYIILENAKSTAQEST